MRLPLLANTPLGTREAMSGAVVVLLVVYFVPTIVAARRRHQDALSIGLLNLFLGWTFLGWVFALVWATKSQSHLGHPASQSSSMPVATAGFGQPQAPQVQSYEKRSPASVLKMAGIVVGGTILSIAVVIAMSGPSETAESVAKEEPSDEWRPRPIADAIFEISRESRTPSSVDVSGATTNIRNYKLENWDSAVYSEFKDAPGLHGAWSVLLQREGNCIVPDELAEAVTMLNNDTFRVKDGVLGGTIARILSVGGTCTVTVSTRSYASRRGWL